MRGHANPATTAGMYDAFHRVSGNVVACCTGGLEPPAFYAFCCGGRNAGRPKLRRLARDIIERAAAAQKTTRFRSGVPLDHTDCQGYSPTLVGKGTPPSMLSLIAAGRGTLWVGRGTRWREPHSDNALRRTGVHALDMV